MSEERQVEYDEEGNITYLPLNVRLEIEPDEKNHRACLYKAYGPNPVAVGATRIGLGKYTIGFEVEEKQVK